MIPCFQKIISPNGNWIPVDLGKTLDVGRVAKIIGDITYCICTRAGGGSQTFFLTHGNHLPSLSGVHGLKDFLHSDHLLE